MKIQRKAVVKINPTDAAAWIANEMDPDDAKPQHGAGLCCLFRVVQVCFILTFLYTSCMLMKTFFFIPAMDTSTTPNPSFIEGMPTLQKVTREDLQDPPMSTLLGLKNFTYLRQPQDDLCSVDNLLFLIVVHSKPDHFRQRQNIRSTWGSLKQFSDSSDSISWSTRTVFVLGETSEGDSFQPSGIGPSVSDLITEESERHGDILRGSFNDHYHNLRFKNILGLRYAVNHCSQAVFILKSDDDTFVDIPGLYRYLVRTFGPLNKSMSNILAGNVFPTGTHPQREGKWAVKQSEYPWTEYPAYLGGLAYLMTPDIARDLHRVAHTSSAPEIWVDDVWVTGLLAHTLRIQPLYLNPRYSYDHKEMKDWFDHYHNRSQRLHHPPFTFAHLDPSQKDWKTLSRNLWESVIAFYDVKQDSGADSRPNPTALL